MAERDQRSETQILATLGRYWGFESLRPLQAEAIRHLLTDSVLYCQIHTKKLFAHQHLPANSGANHSRDVRPMLVRVCRSRLASDRLWPGRTSYDEG